MRIAFLSVVFCFVGCAPFESADDIRGTPEFVRVCPGATTIEGIDVSVYQGSINWPMVAASGKQFAIARIGDGLGTDPTFDTNYAGIAAAGMIRGSYQFFRAGRDPNAMADIVLAHVTSLGPGDLPPVADVELDDGYPSATIIANLHTWSDRIRAALGRDPIIYTGYYFWNGSVAASGDFASDTLWIAAYPTSCTYTGTYCPLIPDAWSGWGMWQYCSSHTIPGISGAVDEDIFQGTRAELMALTGGGGPPPVIYGATYVAQSFPLASAGPRVLHVGETVDEYMDLRNTGTATWDSNTRLGTTTPRDRSSGLAGPEWSGANRYSAVVGTVAPGETYRFNFTVHGTTEGTFDEHIGVVQEGVTWFSDPGEGGPPDNLFEGIWMVLPALPGVDAGTPPVDAGTPPGDGGAVDFGVGPITLPDGAMPPPRDLGGSTGSDAGTGHHGGGCCHVGGTSARGEGGAAVAIGLLAFAAARRRRRG